jgi:hypothetical protein
MEAKTEAMGTGRLLFTVPGKALLRSFCNAASLKARSEWQNKQLNETAECKLPNKPIC